MGNPKIGDRALTLIGAAIVAAVVARFTATHSIPSAQALVHSDSRPTQPASSPQIATALVCHARSGIYERVEDVDTDHCMVSSATVLTATSSPFDECGPDERSLKRIAVRRVPGTANVTIIPCAWTKAH